MYVMSRYLQSRKHLAHCLCKNGSSYTGDYFRGFRAFVEFCVSVSTEQHSVFSIVDALSAGFSTVSVCCQKTQGSLEQTSFPKPSLVVDFTASGRVMVCNKFRRQTHSRRLLSTPAENEERDLSSPGWHPDAVVNQREYAIEGLYSTGKGFSPENIQACTWQFICQHWTCI